MQESKTKFPEHACQYCGAERKWVETLINDEFYWDSDDKMYKPNGFDDLFDHTGNEWCTECKEEWTGS